MSETTLEVEDGVAVFTLNRPEKMNAISQNMFEHDLPDMVARVSEDDDIPVSYTHLTLPTIYSV